MKRYVLPLMLACLAVFPAQAKDHASRLERKIAEIEREYREDVAEIKAEAKLSDAMKQLRLKQKAESKDLKIKQVKETDALKARHKSERDALRQKEGAGESVENDSGKPADGAKEHRKKSQKRKKTKRADKPVSDGD